MPPGPPPPPGVGVGPETTPQYPESMQIQLSTPAHALPTEQLASDKEPQELHVHLVPSQTVLQVQPGPGKQELPDVSVQTCFSDDQQFGVVPEQAACTEVTTNLIFATAPKSKMRAITPFLIKESFINS